MSTDTSWFDSHCHLQSVSGDPTSVLARARAAGVDRVVVVGIDLESSRSAIDLAAFDRGIWATAGLHPHEASKLAAETGQLEVLLHASEVVAVGETGLDYHYQHSPPDEQQTAFRWQIRLAQHFDLPLVIHSREAWDDTFRILGDEGVPPRVIFHCFTGGPTEAERALELGAFLSFGGIVSFPNADDVRAAAAIVPLDRLLIETDAPFLAPVPHRGRENEPAYLPDVGVALAAAVQRSPSEVAIATAENAAAALSL